MTLGLIQTIQKLPYVLAFPPIEAKFSSRICGLSVEAQNTVTKNTNGDQGNCGLSMEFHGAMRIALKPGAALDVQEPPHDAERRGIP